MDARSVELEVLGRSVARKVMHPEIADRADGVDRFLREARCPSRAARLICAARGVALPPSAPLPTMPNAKQPADQS
jgi:hypothetical protein